MEEAHANLEGEVCGVGGGSASAYLELIALVLDVALLGLVDEGGRHAIAHRREHARALLPRLGDGLQTLEEWMQLHDLVAFGGELCK